MLTNVLRTQIKQMFEINAGKHTILLRHKEKIKVIHAKKVRLKNSSIPQMIKHLNYKHKEDKEKQMNLYYLVPLFCTSEL